MDDRTSQASGDGVRTGQAGCQPPFDAAADRQRQRRYYEQLEQLESCNQQLAEGLSVTQNLNHSTERKLPSLEAGDGSGQVSDRSPQQFRRARHAADRGIER